MNTNADQEKLKIAIILARMYGVKETLQPLSFLPNDDIANMIVKWTEEYLNTGEKDIVVFFENKFHLCKK
ncbi:MAG: hypothetical protein J6A94_02270 [Lachnospiraceae bacterium]|nr:hypothetical protein [Lachnospiraceae bacterium]